MARTRMMRTACYFGLILSGISATASASTGGSYALDPQLAFGSGGVAAGGGFAVVGALQSAAGAQATSSSTLTSVSGFLAYAPASADTTPPSVSFPNPVSGSTVTGTVLIDAAASDASGVTKVEFYVDGALKGSDELSPYPFSWDTATVPDGPHAVAAKAYDAAGNSATYSVGVTVLNTFAYDLDEDGKNDGNLAVANCGSTSGQCLKVQYLSTSQEIPFVPGPINFISLGTIGKHFPGGLNAVYVHYDDPNTLLPIVQIFDLNAGKPVAWVFAQAGKTVYDTYFALLRGPGGLKYPFLAPGGGAIPSGTSVPAWTFLCQFDPAKISSPDPSCGTGFRSASTLFSQESVAGTLATPLNTYRHSGGYLDDVDGDGWEDIHLPYLWVLHTLSGRTGAPLATTFYDIAAAVEPGLPHAAYDGRNYGGFAADTGSDGQKQTLEVAGHGVGSFDDVYCGVARFTARLAATPGLPGSRKLDWANDFSYFYNTYADPLATQYQITRRGDFLNKCVHRFSDSLVHAGTAPVVAFSYFTADPPPYDCAAEQIALNQSGYAADKLLALTQCLQQNILPTQGYWTASLRREDNGAGLNTAPNAYLWGKARGVYPGESEAMLMEIFFGGKLPFNRVGYTPDTFYLVGLKPDASWNVLGYVKIKAKPKVNYAQPIEGPVGATWGGLPELVLADMDGDGYKDIQFEDGSWVSYKAAQGGAVLDLTPPVVSISSPADGAIVSGTITVTAAASDMFGVSKVEFYVDGVLKSTDISSPYNYIWDSASVSSGAHQLAVKAYDSSSNSAAQYISIGVDNAPPALSGVAASSVTFSGARISWATDEYADSQVDYGSSTAYGAATLFDSSRTLAHAQALSGLAAGTLYHYRVRSRDALGNMALSGDFVFTTPALPVGAPPSPWGVTLGKVLGIPGSPDRARDASAGAVRFDVSWNDLEPVKGSYNFSYLGSLLQPYWDRGIETVLNLRPYTTWGSACNRQVNLDNAGCPPADTADWERFIKDLTAHLAGRVRFLQIGNEIMDDAEYWAGAAADYVPVLNGAYDAVKSVSPETSVLLAGFDAALLERAVGGDAAAAAAISDQLARGKYDFADLHLYGLHGNIHEKIDWVKARTGKPLLSTESSGPNPDIEPYTHAKQSDELVKRYAIGLAGGLQSVFWFNLYNRPDASTMFRTMGLIELDGATLSLSTKPAYYTYQLMAQKLSGFSAVQTIERYSQYRFDFSSYSVYAAWDDAGGARQVSLPFSQPAARVTHLIASTSALMPASELVPVVNGLASITLSSSPVFVEGVAVPPDTVPPVLSSVAPSQIALSSAVVSWVTDEPADAQVDYGSSAAYGLRTALSTAATGSHAQKLVGLSAGTLYHYRARSRDAAGNLAVSGDFTFTTLPLPGGIAPPLPALGLMVAGGVNIAGTPDVVAGLKAGIGRFSASWADLEPVQGSYQFGVLEAQLQPYWDRGFETLVNLKPSSRWGSNCSRTTDLVNAGCPIKDDAAWRRFVSQFAAYFKGRIKFLQIGNEISDNGAYWAGSAADYIPALNSAYDAAKPAAPDLQIVLAGFASGALEAALQGDAYSIGLLEGFLRDGKYDYADVHLYHDYARIADKISWVAARSSSPILSTESGGVDPRVAAPSDGAQAQEVVKRLASGLANGLKSAFWFSLYDMVNEASTYSNMGLIDRDPVTLSTAAKPSYYTYQMLAQKLSGFKSASVLAPNGHYRFDLSSYSAHVLWNDAGSRQATLAFAQPNVRLTSVVTSTRPSPAAPTQVVPVTGGQVTITLSSSPVIVEPIAEDVLPPSLTLSASSAAVVGSSVFVIADPADNGAVDRVEFSLDGSFVRAATGPYSFTWDTAGAAIGAHLVSAVAFDAGGNSAGAAITITLSSSPSPSPPPGPQPPAAAIISPSSGTVVSSTVSVAVAASAGAGLARVELRLDGALLGTLSTAPFSFSWNSYAAENGTHTLTAAAFDVSGASSSHSIPVLAANWKTAVPLASGTASAVSGGTVGVVATSLAQITLPPGAVGGAVEIRILPEDTGDAAAEALKRAGERALGLTRGGGAVQILAVEVPSLSPVEKLAKPALVSVSYDPSLSSGTIGLYFWDAQLRQWSSVAGAVADPSRRSVTASVDRLGTLAVYFIPPAAAPLAFGEVFAYPNPALGRSVTVHVEADAAQALELRLYDLGGRLLHRRDVLAAPVVGVNNRSAYELPWDVSGLASGGYVLLARASLNGQTVEKTIKLAVVR